MGCLQNKLMDIFLFVKMLFFGSIAGFQEWCDTIKPLKGKTDVFKFNLLQ